MHDALVLNNLCEYLSSSQYFYDLIKDIFNDIINNTDKNIKIPNNLDYHIQSLRNRYKELNEKNNSNKWDAELEEFLDTKGLRLMMDEIKHHNNFIGVLKYATIGHTELFCDIFESKIEL